MSGFGFAVIEGRRYEITRLALAGGMLWLRAHGHGPAPAADGVPAALFGADGQGVCQGWRLTIPAIGAGRDVTIYLPVRIDVLESQAAGRTLWVAAPCGLGRRDTEAEAAGVMRAMAELCQD